MRRGRAWCQENLAASLRHDYQQRREDAAFTVREFGGEVSFGDEPDWELRAKEMLDAEIARLAYESIMSRRLK
jgi:hypothetical protein